MLMVADYHDTTPYIQTPLRTGSLRPWMVILTAVGALAVAAMLVVPRVRPRRTRGWGRNSRLLRLMAAARGADLNADLCSRAPPKLEAMLGAEADASSGDLLLLGWSWARDACIGRDRSRTSCRQ